jgi:hypothetical protein
MLTPAAQRDETEDLLGGHGPAAACDGTHEIADAVDHHAGRRDFGRRLGGYARFRRFALVHAPMDRACNLRQGQLALAKPAMQRLHARQSQVGEQLGERGDPDSEPIQLTLEHLPALVAVLCLVLLANQARTLARLPGDARYPSCGTTQSRLGCGCFAGMISTVSPFAILWFSGTMRPFTRAPRQR